MSDTTSIEQPRSTNGHLYIGHEYDEDDVPEDFAPGSALLPIIVRVAVSVALGAIVVGLIVRRMRANQQSAESVETAWGA